MFDVSAGDWDPGSFKKAFERHRVVHLRNARTLQSPGQGTLCWQDIRTMFEQLDEADKESWCIETQGAQSLEPTSFLQSGDCASRAYCSFLVQKDEAQYDALLDRLPVRDMPSISWSYERAVWFFFGRNPEGRPELQGRPEHTDSVTHDGTWHFQLSGKKQWVLRPTRRLLERIQKYDWTEDSSFKVNCSESDILIIEYVAACWANQQWI